MQHIYNRLKYVEDAIMHEMQNHPSDDLGRDLLFIKFFRLRLSSRIKVDPESWYPINVEDYISWQIAQYERFDKEGKSKNAFKKGHGYRIDYLALEIELNSIVENDDYKKLVDEINSIWRRWGFNKKYIIPSSAKYRNDLDKWNI